MQKYNQVEVPEDLVERSRLLTKYNGFGVIVQPDKEEKSCFKGILEYAGPDCDVYSIMDDGEYSENFLPKRFNIRSLDLMLVPNNGVWVNEV